VPIWAREITEKRRCSSSSSSRFELPAIVREATVWIERETGRRKKAATEDEGEHLCSFFKLCTLGHETMHHT
jgi:hypothetical protein